MYACQVGHYEIARYLTSVGGADHTIRSHLSGRDAKMISADAKFDKLTDVISDLDR